MAVEQAIVIHERVLGVAPGSRVVGSPKGDALLVTDTRQRIERLQAVLGLLDLPGGKGRRIFVRPVIHRPASELVSVTRRVFGDDMGHGVGLAPDDRSNQMIIRATAAQYRTIDRLLRRLDIRPRDERRIFVLPGRTSLPLPGK